MWFAWLVESDWAQLASVAWPNVSNVTATTVLGWYAWHTSTKTLPSLIESFREEMAANRYEYRSERDAMRGELASERRERHADNAAIVAALRELSDRLPANGAVRVETTRRGASDAS